MVRLYHGTNSPIKDKTLNPRADSSFEKDGSYIHASTDGRLAPAFAFKPEGVDGGSHTAYVLENLNLPVLVIQDRKKFFKNLRPEGEILSFDSTCGNFQALKDGTGAQSDEWVSDQALDLNQVQREKLRFDQALKDGLQVFIMSPETDPGEFTKLQHHHPEPHSAGFLADMVRRGILRYYNQEQVFNSKRAYLIDLSINEQEVDKAENNPTKLRKLGNPDIQAAIKGLQKSALSRAKRINPKNSEKYKGNTLMMWTDIHTPSSDGDPHLDRKLLKTVIENARSFGIKTIAIESPSSSPPISPDESYEETQRKIIEYNFSHPITAEFLKIYHSQEDLDDNDYQEIAQLGLEEMGILQGVKQEKIPSLSHDNEIESTELKEEEISDLTSEWQELQNTAEEQGLQIEAVDADIAYPNIFTESMLVISGIPKFIANLLNSSKKETSKTELSKIKGKIEAASIVFHNITEFAYRVNQFRDKQLAKNLKNCVKAGNTLFFGGIAHVNHARNSAARILKDQGVPVFNIDCHYPTTNCVFLEQASTTSEAAMDAIKTYEKLFENSCPESIQLTLQGLSTSPKDHEFTRGTLSYFRQGMPSLFDKVDGSTLDQTLLFRTRDDNGSINPIGDIDFNQYDSLANAVDAVITIPNQTT